MISGAVLGVKRDRLIFQTIGRVAAASSAQDTHDGGWYYDHRIVDAYRKARKKQYESQEKLREELKAMLREATESPLQEVAKEAQSIERQLIARKGTNTGKRATIKPYVDYDRLIADAALALRLIELYMLELKRREDDAILVLLLDS